MKISLSILFSLAVYAAAMMCLLTAGCQGPTPGIDNGSAGGYVGVGGIQSEAGNGIREFQAIKGGHSDAVGSAIADQGIGSMNEVVRLAGVVNDSIGHVQEVLRAAVKAKDAAIAAEKAAKATLGYIIGQWCIRLFWLIGALLAIHVVCSLLALFLPEPYKAVAGIVAKIVNPLGWLTWLVSHAEMNAAKNSIGG